MKHKSTLILPFLLWTICAFTSLSVNAQEQVFKRYSLNEGLPSTTVYDALEDKDGFLWFATENGVSRFDGTGFLNFTTADGLTDNAVLTMFEDKLGRIWLNGFKGEACYYLKGKIHNPSNDSFLAKLPPIGFVLSSIQVPNGPIYMATDHGYLKIMEDSFYLSPYGKFLPNNQATPLDAMVSSYVPNKRTANRILHLNDSLELILFGDTLVDLRNSKPTNSPIKIPSHYHFPNYQKKIGNDFWICSYMEGVLKISDVNTPSVKYTEYLKQDKISKVIKDREGNYWFTTLDKGILQLPVNQRGVFSYYQNPYLKNENILKISMDALGGMWIGLTKSRVVYIKDGLIYLIEIPTKGTYPKSAVYEILPDNKGNAVIATTFSLGTIQAKNLNKTMVFTYTEAKGLHPRAINHKDIAQLNNNQICVVQGLGLSIFKQDKQTGILTMVEYHEKLQSRSYHAFQSKAGNLWVSNSLGLFILGKNGFIPQKLDKALLNEPITQMAELNDGHFLLLTRSKGILLFNGHSILQVFGEKEGLISNICNELLLVGDTIYVATAKGIGMAYYGKGKIQTIRNYRKEDGLITNEVNDLWVKDQMIYAATAEGLCILPQNLRSTYSTPNLYWLGIWHGDKEISNFSSYELPLNSKSIRFGFRAITFHQNNAVTYQYRIKGIDQDWKTTKGNEIEYPNLSAGKYVFEVRTSKVGGKWSSTLNYPFQVIAPIYQRRWFIFSCSFIFLLASLWVSYYFIKKEQEKKRNKQMLLNRLSTLEFQALNALMNPHFIFNAINSIQQFLNTNNALEANQYLSKFARLTRMNMESVMKGSVSVDDELERIQLYLNFEQLRLTDRLHFHIHLSEILDLELIQIPPMILQPLLENAIWHGMPQTGNLNLRVEIVPLFESQFEISIKDNGVGIENRKRQQSESSFSQLHTSKGLQLIKQRLDLWTQLNGTTYSLSIIQNQVSQGTNNPGTSVTLILPQVLKSEEST